MGAQAARITDALTRKVEGVCRMLALEIAKELIKGTPVDTGHARRNWIPSVGQPNTQEAGDDSAHAQGVAEVLAYKLASGSLWVANVVPYIRSLNYGHSQQKPAGWVERAIALALAAVERKGADVSSMRESFARRSENAQGHGPAPDGADGAGWSGGEYG